MAGPRTVSVGDHLKNMELVDNSCEHKGVGAELTLFYKGTDVATFGE